MVCRSNILPLTRAPCSLNSGQDARMGNAPSSRYRLDVPTGSPGIHTVFLKDSEITMGAAAVNPRPTPY